MLERKRGRGGGARAGRNFTTGEGDICAET